MSDEPCYSLVKKPKGFEASNESTLKSRIEGSDLEECQAAVQELTQNALNGDKFPKNLMMPVINRYQMNRFSTAQKGIREKEIKKLLYILWECLPKRGPDGKFLDRMVMVCGAFDKDLKHPNEYVCGSALRALEKTREPDVIRELVHSIEKCLDLPHPYQRRNAITAISEIYIRFPDLNPSAPKLISEHLVKESDEDCKRAALKALLKIDPEEAKPYLHSSNVQDIHRMNSSLQLIYVRLVKEIFKKNSDEASDYLEILRNLTRSSSWPAVRYQAASTLMKFTRASDDIKLVASCFIDICAKNSDNNGKIDTLERLTNLRKINGAERVLRNLVMDILFILQSATDFEIQQKILNISLDLMTPLNIGAVVVTLKQEIERSVTDPEKAKYRRLLVDSVYKIAERFPNAIVEHEMVDTLFNLLTSNTVSERTSSRLILLFRDFMLSNPKFQGAVVKKILGCFNMVKDNISTQHGLIKLLGDFAQTKEQIEETYTVFRDSFGELPTPETIDSRKFDTVSVLCYALPKMACRYEQSNATKNEKLRMNARFMSILVSLAKLGNSNSTDSEGNIVHMNNDHLESLMMGLELLHNISNMSASHRRELDGDDYDDEAHRAGLIKKILAENDQVDEATRTLEKLTFSDDSYNKNNKLSNNKKARFDHVTSIPLLVARVADMNLDKQLELKNDVENPDELEVADEDFVPMPLMPEIFREIPLTGSIDPIYAYCVLDVNHYNINVKIYLESRARTTLENVNIELIARGDNATITIDRPDPIVLAPRAKACITSNIKVFSAENRHLFGYITYDSGAGGNEQIITLDDFTINITDYIHPASISFEDFRDYWRHCEWENKVGVKTKLTNPMEYLKQLISSTNMRCLTTERQLQGECVFLLANMYAQSSFGEEVLVNVSLEKETSTSIVTGSVKIRSRSQGMVVSLGAKISKPSED